MKLMLFITGLSILVIFRESLLIYVGVLLIPIYLIHYIGDMLKKQAMEKEIEKQKAEQKAVIEAEKARKAAEQKEEIEKITNDVIKLIKKHFETLSIKFNQNKYEDDYGNLKLDNRKWTAELRYFLDNVIYPNTELNKIMDSSNNKDIDFVNGVFTRIYNSQISQNNVLSTKKIKTGKDYECYIESLLSKGGLNVKRTPETGDQGVDLIVNFNNESFAIQCKYYSKPVGNKAVQEIAAGSKFYNCDYAIVVSNQTYTLSAKKLAKNLNVFLLNEDSLVDFFVKYIDNIGL